MALLSAALLSSAHASEPAFATNWVKEHSTSVRLIGGGADLGTGGPTLVAGVEIRLDDGWKTYWRNPGSSGVPPRVDWAGSENLAEATLLFPAPQRFVDKEGDTIGYKKSVVLPVIVRPRDPAKPVVLKLALEYGVCREVCIPVQPNFTLQLPSAKSVGLAGSELLGAIARVPKDVKSRRPGDPLLKSVTIELTGPKPRIAIAAEFPGGAKGADMFLEAPDGLWVPLPKPMPGSEGAIRTFEVDLTDGADIGDLKGREIRVTLVSEAGQSQATFKLE